MTMKRVFLALVAVFASVVTFAGSPLKVTNSTVALKQFMKEQANATLVIDWSKAQYDNKKFSGQIHQLYRIKEMLESSPSTRLVKSM